MKNTISRISLIIAAGCATILSSCGKKNPVTGEYLAPPSTYALNGSTFSGQGDVNTSLKAIEVPCANNNTIRMYISDSLDIHGASFSGEHIKIVSFAKSGHLNRLECYLEVTSSATDTWLSTGTGNVTVSSTIEQYHAGPGDDKSAAKFYFVDATVQHFTSVPLNEFGKVSATFKLK